MLDVQTERVLVVPTELFHDLGHFQGFSTDVERYLRQLFDPRNTSYRPRREVEHDPSYQATDSLRDLPPSRLRGPRDALSVHPRQGSRRGPAAQQAERGRRRPHRGRRSHRPIPTMPYAEGMRRELDEEVIVDSPFDQCNASA